MSMDEVAKEMLEKIRELVDSDTDTEEDEFNFLISLRENIDSGAGYTLDDEYRVNEIYEKYIG